MIFGEDTAVCVINRGGSDTGECLKQQGRQIAGIEIKASATLKAEDFKGLNKLKDACGKQFAAGVVFYDGESILPFGEKLFSFTRSPALNTYLGPAGVKNSAAENCTWWLTCI